MAKKLLIVESPAKAKTIGKYLGGEFTVKSSVGHIRDLPKENSAIRVSETGPDSWTFAPTYVVSEGKEKVVAELKAATKASDEIYLASDPDREGEAIAWHLKEVLSPAILSLALDAKGSAPAVAQVLQSPYLGIFMLLFVGTLMASRLPTISLKHLHISRKAMPFVLAGLLLLIAFLVSHFWLTLGVVGVGYIFTVPVSGLLFLRTRARYEQTRES